MAATAIQDNRESTDIARTPQGDNAIPKRKLTVRALLESGLIGIWEDRVEIGDSSQFARSIRESADLRCDRE